MELLSINQSNFGAEAANKTTPRTRTDLKRSVIISNYKRNNLTLVSKNKVVLDHLLGQDSTIIINYYLCRLCVNYVFDAIFGRINQRSLKQ